MLIAVYEGTEVASLTPVAQTACSSQAGELRFTAQKGHPYVIALDGEEGVTSEFEIQVLLPTSELPPSVELIRQDQGDWLITVRNLAGRRVRLEYSADCRQWELEASSPGGADVWYWPVPMASQPDPPARFFRAVTLE